MYGRKDDLNTTNEQCSKSSGVTRSFYVALDTRTRCLFLIVHLSAQALYDTFSLFGNILSCKVATDETGASKGYGYVHYETGVSANMAIAKINGMLIAGKQVCLRYSR